jgi:hypothetical protein
VGIGKDVSKPTPPQDVATNRLYRAWLWKRVSQSKRLRQQVMEWSREDVAWWIDSWVWQYNPNALGQASQEVGPFITWNFQKEAIRQILRAMEEKHDLLFLKSREMGASWLCLLAMDQPFLFQSRKKFLMISRNADAVWRPGDSDSLFWKLDFVHEHLPEWMTEGRVERRGMVYTNPLAHSAMSGQASTGASGVGGRATAMFIDEFSLIREDYEVLHHTANTTGCRIFNGTHRGTGTAFHDLTQRVDLRKVLMHWSQHPDKARGAYTYHPRTNKIEVHDKTYSFPEGFEFERSELPAGGPFPGLRSPYYDEQCVKQGSRQAIAMNLDIDAGGSQSQVFDAIKIRSVIGTFACDPYIRGELEYDEVLARKGKFVASPEGRLKLWTKLDMEGNPPKGYYTIGVDSAAGTGATPTCISIFDARLGEKVAEYANPFLEPTPAAYLVVALAWWFKDADGNGAFLAWEIPGPGVTMGKRIMELGYRHVFHKEDVSKWGQKQVFDSPGWVNNIASKRTLIEQYRAAIQGREIINRSEEALKECLAFHYTEGGKIEHAREHSGDDPSGARENHGDQTIADAMAYKLLRKLNVLLARQEKKEAETPVGSLAWRRELDKLARQQSADHEEAVAITALGW